MNLRLTKTHYPVTVLGPGRRIGIWVRGCTIGCRGCLARDTWEAGPEDEVPVPVLLAWCRRVGRHGVEGVTISGGEPFEQPRALGELLDGLRAWDRERADTEGAAPLDLLCYSGLAWRKLARDHQALLERLDAVIPEPYLDDAARPGAWRGSANQPIVPLTALGRQRYPDGIDTGPGPPSVQIAVDGSRVWMIGIPRRGDLMAFEQLAATRGLNFEEVSWRV